MACNFGRNPNCATTSSFSSIAYFFLASNSLGFICRAYSHRDYYTVAFVVFEYSAFLLLDLCKTAFYNSPSQNNRSKWRKFLKLAILVLYSAIFFGISIYFGPLFSDPVCGYSLYVISALGCALMFYVCVVLEDRSGLYDECLGEEKVREVKIQVFYDSVWEKV